MTSEYFERGHDLFKREPDLIVAEVWWRAGKVTGDFGERYEFVMGYTNARRQDDDYRREQKGV